MQDLIVIIFGKPEGIIVSQLIYASQYTIYLSAIAFLGGGVLGGALTFLRLIPNYFLNTLSFVYVWLFQSIPLLMLLFLLGLGFPRLIGQNIDPWLAASIALIVFTSAYLSEVWRGAILAIPRGQWEAGKALNLNFWKTLRFIIF